jgi:hypothetical protein
MAENGLIKDLYGKQLFPWRVKRLTMSPIRGARRNAQMSFTIFVDKFHYGK